MCGPIKRISGSTTSSRSSKEPHTGTRAAQSGKKNTNSVVLVAGGFGAMSVSTGLRAGAGTTPVEPKRARGVVNDASFSLLEALGEPMSTAVSYSRASDWCTTRNIRSASSGCASTIQGNLDRIAIAGRRAPTESKACTSPSFWFGTSFLGSSFFASGALLRANFELEEPPDSRGAAIASWLTFAPAIRASTFARYALWRASMPSSAGLTCNERVGISV